MWCVLIHTLSILRPKQTQTNHKCQRYCVFVFVIVQEQIFQKLAQIRPKRKKNEHEFGNHIKSQTGEANYHF